MADRDVGVRKLVIVRHGERADEVHGHEWHGQRDHTNWHDPPLTTGGHGQARAAAERLVTRLAEQQFDIVYCSPFTRCVETAVPIAQALAKPIQIVPALGECAIAARQSEGRIPGLPFPSLASWRERFPVVEFLDTLHTDKLEAAKPLPEDKLVPDAIQPAGVWSLQPFIHGTDTLLEHVTTDTVLCVAHREAAKALAQLKIGTSIRRPPYCGVVEFSIRGHTGQWTLHQQDHE
eukprot:m.484137 g.484137  ORF g.484137 m.484137 type:complete len:234 (-) comp23227_c0_seq1:30-731(-)